MRIRFPLIFSLVMVLLAVPALGQAGPGGGQGGPGGQGGYGGFGGGGQGGQMPQITPDMIQQFMTRMQQRVMDNIKTQLQCSDDEFTALQPYIQKVLTLQTATTLSRVGGLRVGGQNIGAMLSAGQPPSDLQTASSELQAAIDDPATTPGVMESKLAALREARGKAQDDLSAAQDNLRSLLTQRQEGALVVMGLLQ
jgi:hypothetical protein